jgi:ribonuclease HII
LTLERAAGGLVAGIDEAGRGPWAGPVVAAAVIIDVDLMPRDLAGQIDDSKVLRPAKRVELAAALIPCARIGIGAASVDEIDQINILQATFLAMTRALTALGVLPDTALVDGNKLPDLPCAARAIVKGDSKSLSIAAASIIAKVTRDRAMAMLSSRYPGFGWDRNAGYGTAQHRAGLAQFGVTPHHRRSYAPIRKILETGD